MHYGITIAAAKEYLTQPTAQLCSKCTVNDFTGQMCQRHVRIDTMTIEVTRALRTSGIAVAGDLNLVLVNGFVIKHLWSFNIRADQPTKMQYFV